jgi:hypothetical protein
MLAAAGFGMHELSADHGLEIWRTDGDFHKLDC